MDWTVIIKTLIEVAIPSLVTLYSLKKLSSQNKMHSAKQSILQMQMEDVIAWELLHEFPYNYSNIHYEYDEYKKNGGNSDIDKKMKEYEKWYESINKKGAKNGNHKARTSTD